MFFWIYVKDYCNYVLAPKAWLNLKEFNQIIEKLNRKMIKENRKILLILDNAPSHEKKKQYSNIKLLFLFKNSTGFLQPLNAGIIRSFKAKYKKYMLRRVLEEYDNGKQTHEAFKSVDLKKAIIFSKWAWDDVSAETIQNCWKKTGLVGENEILKTTETEEETEEINEILNHLDITNPMIAEEYINVETDLDNIDMVIDDDDVVELILRNEDNKSVENVQKKTNKDEENSYKYTTSEAINASKIVEAYVLLNEGDIKMTNMIKDSYNYIYNMKKKKKQ